MASARKETKNTKWMKKYLLIIYIIISFFVDYIHYHIFHYTIMIVVQDTFKTWRQKIFIYSRNCWNLEQPTILLVTTHTNWSFEGRLDKFWEKTTTKILIQPGYCENTTGHDLIINSSDEKLTEKTSCGGLQSEEDMWVLYIPRK